MSTPVQPNRDSAYDTYDDGRNNRHPDDNVTMRPRDLRRSTPASGDQPRGERTQRSTRRGSSTGGRRSDTPRSGVPYTRTARDYVPGDSNGHIDRSDFGDEPTGYDPRFDVESDPSIWRPELDDSNWYPGDEPVARIDDEPAGYNRPRAYPGHRTSGAYDPSFDEGYDGDYDVRPVPRGQRPDYGYDDRFERDVERDVRQELRNFRSLVDELEYKLFPSDQRGEILFRRVNISNVRGINEMLRFALGTKMGDPLRYLIAAGHEHMRHLQGQNRKRGGNDTTSARRRDDYDDGYDTDDYYSRDERNNRTNGRRPSGGFGRTVRRVVSRFIDDRAPDDND